MKVKTIIAYSDSGHGWAKVKITELKKLNLLDKISSFSYVNGDYAFLEEDCDLSVYVKELQTRGIAFKFKQFSTNRSSKIRSYRSFSSHSYINAQ